MVRENLFILDLLTFTSPPTHPHTLTHTQYVNSSFVRLTGFSKEEALGRPASEMMKMIDVRSENGPFPSTQPLKVCPVT